jgi:hypothetical protein
MSVEWPGCRVQGPFLFLTLINPPPQVHLWGECSLFYIFIYKTHYIEFFSGGDFPEESTNVLHEILRQISGYNSNPSDLRYFVAGAGTGGTMTSVGR